MATDQKDGTFPWHAMSAAAAVQTLGVTDRGLSAAAAAARLASHGPNRLPRKPPPSIVEIFLRQFRSPLIYILLAAAVLSAALHEYVDAGFIAGVLLLNALIGGFQEWRAELNTQALQQLLRMRATVLRDGRRVELDAEQLVPGDVVWLESGNRVPADLRLLTAQGFEVDESLLTGESLAVTKDPARELAPSTGLGDRVTMAFAGAVVARGRGKGLVVATGTGTVIGQLARDVASTAGGVPPLLQRMERFTRAIALGVLIAAAVVALVGIFGRGHTAGEMFLVAVALAVSAIPEGLPVALTVALAVATSRMAKRHVIVRRLAAVEGLGSCTLIASDKTGTLTCNELTVREAALPSGASFTVTGEGFAPEGEVQLDGRDGDRPGLERLARAAALCNEADLSQRDGVWHWNGDPTDVALLSLAGKLGLTREAALATAPEVGRIPFEPESRFAAACHREEGQARLYVKGAPERVMSMCGEADRHDDWRALAGQMAERGYRVLAMAEGPAAEPFDPSREPAGLTFLGFVGMIDPARHGVREAIQACRDAGIGVCMVTGDHPVTALAIARDLGLAERPDQVVTGEYLATRPADEVAGLIARIRVFARVSPRQKLELVEAARKAGQFVAVTGDGVNDAPALRAANIGVAMGKGGTDVAREAADLVIADDNFATIVAGVEEGRVAYENVRKVIYLLVSTGAAEVLLVFLALGFGLPLPLLAVQFLWLNLVTNGIQDVALAFEPGEGDELRHRPRPPGEPIFNRLLIERTAAAAAVIGGVSFAAFAWMLNNGWEEASARNALLLLVVLFQNIHIANCRSETRSAFVLSPLRSPILMVGTIAAQLLHVAVLYLPLGHVLLKTEPVTLTTWLTLLALATTVLGAIELHKWTWRLRYPEPPREG